MQPTALVCAYSSLGTVALQSVLDAGITVKALFTYEPTPEDHWFTPPEVLARANGIPIFKVSDFNSEDNFQRCQELQPDLLFSFYFRDMIQDRFLTLPKLGAYNLHGSLLPRYRGRAPINWVLAHGESETGLSLHCMTEKPDDGDVVAQSKISSAWDETPLSLTHKMSEVAPHLLRSVLPLIAAGQPPRQRQSELGPSSYFGRRRPEDSELRFEMTTRQAFNEIRAVAEPWPTAYLKGKGHTLYVPWAIPSDDACPVGHYRLHEQACLLGFQEGALALHRVRLNQEKTSVDPLKHAAWLDLLGIPSA